MKDTFGSYDPACAVTLVKQFEGYEAEPYFCSAGKKTIGYGHVIQPKEHLEYVSITEAESLLVKDLKKHATALAPVVNAECTLGNYVALLSLAFNVGVANVKGSTLLKKFNMGDIHGAADEFTRWVYAGGKVVSGLKRRRDAERKVFLSDIDSEGDDA